MTAKKITGKRKIRRIKKYRELTLADNRILYTIIFKKKILQGISELIEHFVSIKPKSRRALSKR